MTISIALEVTVESICGKTAGLRDKKSISSMFVSSLFWNFLYLHTKVRTDR